MRRGRFRKRSSRQKNKRASSAPPSLESPKKRLKWSNESMINAIEAVKQGCSIKQAAEEHGVPRTTLNDRISGRVMHGKKPGPEPYLNKQEEEDLANFVEVVADIGFGKTKKQIKAMVEKTARDKSTLRKEKISDGWFRRFLERQPHLSLRKGDRTAAIRIDAMKNQSALDNYFIELNRILDDNQLKDKPSQIYNMDETGVPLDHRTPRVLTRKGQKKVRYCSTGNKSQITVVGCINATGQALPPFIVFDAKNLNLQWTTGEVPGTTYGLSESGWMDNILFKEWFIKHFLSHAGSGRPLLLLMDGHSSHYNLEAVTMARNNGVILFTLVPHTTHEMQPLDTAVYAPLKAHWQDVCHCYLQSHPGKVITKYQFSQLFSEAWLKAMNPANIISGFRSCGIFPFNPTAVLDHDPCVCQSNSSSGSISESVITAHHDILQPNDDSNTEDAVCESFTAEDEIRYERRHSEGYDLYDPKYISWLKIKYPDEDCERFKSLIEHFSDASVLEEVTVTSDTHISIVDRDLSGSTPSRKSSGASRSLVMETSVNSEESQSLSSAVTPLTPKLNVHGSNLTPVNTNSSLSSICTPTSSKSSSTPISPNMISKYLVQYIPAPAERKKAAETRVTGSRVLTSAEGIAILQEKDEKKKKEKEEKERKKQERLNKKKEKDDLAKKKAEEKAKKVADKGKPMSTKRSRRKCPPSSESHQLADDAGSSSSVARSSVVGEPSSSTLQPSPDDYYECSECFGTYKEDKEMRNGAEWIRCGCGQWIHEECISNTVMGSDGTERMCSNCVL